VFGPIQNSPYATTSGSFQFFLGEDSQISNLTVTFLPDNFAVPSTISSSSQRTADEVTITLTFEPKNIIPLSGLIYIQVPPEIIY
jgi:hypothetical protein